MHKKWEENKNAIENYPNNLKNHDKGNVFDESRKLPAKQYRSVEHSLKITTIHQRFVYFLV